MKNIYCLISLFFCLHFNVFGQKEIYISGGNRVSAMLCANNDVYVWGSNKSGDLGVIGGLGINNTIDTAIKIPTKVIFPGGPISILQVHAGSGSHFLAIDCNSNVWSWGNNLYGQVGNGTSNNIVTVPSKVKAGVLTGNPLYDDGLGNLKGVSAVYGGNNNSFAILNDGRVLAWGSNGKGKSFSGWNDDSYGQVGDGSVGNCQSTANYLNCGLLTSAPTVIATPVLVKNGLTGSALTNVIKISAGDGVTLALVDTETPLDGLGTVYSWGNGKLGLLGRTLQTTGPYVGTYNDNPNVNDWDFSNVDVSGSAYPVMQGTVALKNISQISAGDVFAMALDNNGFIWSWGEGSWNNATGINNIGGAGNENSLKGPYPLKVRKGLVDAADHDGTFLKA